MEPRTIPDTAVIVAADDVLASEFASEYVLLNLRNGTYYGLADVGGEIWKLIQAPTTVGDICRAIVEAFEVDPETCRRDLLGLLADLHANRLVDIRDRVP